MKTYENVQKGLKNVRKENVRKVTNTKKALRKR